MMEVETTSIAVAPLAFRIPIARVLDRLTFGLIVICLLVTTAAYGANQPWWEATFAVMAYSVGILRIAHGCIVGEWRVTNTSMLIPLGALALFALLQTTDLGFMRFLSFPEGDAAGRTISADPFETRRFLLKFLGFVVLGEALTRFTYNKTRLQLVVWAAVSVALLTAIFGIVRFVFQGSAEGFLLPRLKPDVGFAQFINRNHFSYAVEMAFGLLLGLMLDKRAGTTRVALYFNAALVLFVAIVLANSRGGVMVAFCQLLLFMWVLVGRWIESFNKQREKLKKMRNGRIGRWFSSFRSKSERQRYLEEDQVGATSRRSRRSRSKPKILQVLGLKALQFASVATIAVLLYFFVAAVGGENLEKRFDELPDEVAEEKVARVRRVDIWAATRQMIAERYLAGAGFAAYQTAIPRYHEASGSSTPRAAMNEYMELLASGGVIGTLLVAWLTILIAFNVRKQMRVQSTFRRAACAGAIIGILGVGIHSMVEFGLHTTSNALLFVILIVIATVAVGDRRKQRESLDTGHHEGQ